MIDLKQDFLLIKVVCFTVGLDWELLLKFLCGDLIFKLPHLVKLVILAKHCLNLDQSLLKGP